MTVCNCKYSGQVPNIVAQFTRYFTGVMDDCVMPHVTRAGLLTGLLIFKSLILQIFVFVLFTNGVIFEYLK